MNNVTVTEYPEIVRYIIVTQQGDIGETLTNTIYVSDQLSKAASIVEITRGIQGFDGPPGKDGLIFDILPIASGGTNSSSFDPNKVIYFDGVKLTSSNKNIEDIATNGVVAGTGMVIISSNGSIFVHSNLGSGLSVVDNKISVNFDLIDTKILEKINVVAGSGLVFTNNSYNIGSSPNIQVYNDHIDLSNTGVPGTYTKITTDSKGRVISGSSLISSDITNALGYTPWSVHNDGHGSELDADKLDGNHGSYYRNSSNLTGILNDSIFPKYVQAGSYTKVYFSNDGVITGATNQIYSEITGSLGYLPVNPNSTNIGSLLVNGSLFSGNIIRLYDNVPIVANNHGVINYNEPRGFRFLYGNSTQNPKTGILAYYPGTNRLRLVAETSDIVITDRLGSGLYSSLTNNNSFLGINTFLNDIHAKLISITGLNINNNNLIINFNADYLDNNHGYFYRDAKNLTGVLNANGYPVSITNLSGTNYFIPKFDNRTSDPSRTISNSIITEINNNININDGNLLVGIDNTISTGITTQSIVVGTNNKIVGELANIAAFGSDHEISAMKAFAANSGAVVTHESAVALGNNPRTWSHNQNVYGIFSEPTGINSGYGHGQYSTIGLSYYGQIPDFETLEPRTIFLPKNKTILYNLDVVMSKLGSTGTACFRFESGLIRNYTRKNPINLAVDENFTVVLKEPTKKTIYNNSYIRDYYYGITNNKSSDDTKLKVVDDPISSENYVHIKNLNNTTNITYNPASLTGYYFHNESSNYINLKLDKPRVSGFFTQEDEDYKLTIKSYSHNAVTGTFLTIRFYSGSRTIPVNDRYLVTDIIDENALKVSLPLDLAKISGVNGNIATLLIPSGHIKNNYDSYDKLYIRHLNGNTFVYSDIYNIQNLSYTTYNDIPYKVITIDNAVSNLLSLSQYELNRVFVAPASSNTGYCDIIPKRNFSGIYQFQNNSVTYNSPIKAFYSQEASDEAGYSLITVSVLYNNRNPWMSEYKESGNISYAINNTYMPSLNVLNLFAGFDFAQYINTTYITGLYENVTGLIIDTKYSSLHGEYYQLDGTTLNYPTGNANIYIKNIDNNNINLYVTSLNRDINNDYTIFVPYDNITSINSTGFISIIESGAYKSGLHPPNGQYSILSYDLDGFNEVYQFSIVAKYTYPHSSGHYIPFGCVDIYGDTAYENVQIENLLPQFNRDKNLENVYVNFNNANISNNNFDLIDGIYAQTQSTTIQKSFFYPEQPRTQDSEGFVNVCADQDHGLIVDSQSIYGVTPVIFYPYLKGSAKDAIYKISQINGNNINIDNSTNHLRNENGKQTYIGTYYTKQIKNTTLSPVYPGVLLTDDTSKFHIGTGEIVNISGTGTYGNNYQYLCSSDFWGGNANLDDRFLVNVTGFGSNIIPANPPFNLSTSNVFVTKVSSGICEIPQNNIYFNTDVAYQNFGNRWGKKLDGSTINSPILAKYTIFDPVLDQEIRHLAIAEELAFLVRDTYAVKQAHDAHIDEHLNDNRVFNVYGTGILVNVSVTGNVNYSAVTGNINYPAVTGNINDGYVSSELEYPWLNNVAWNGMNWIGNQVTTPWMVYSTATTGYLMDTSTTGNIVDLSTTGNIVDLSTTGNVVDNTVILTKAIMPFNFTSGNMVEGFPWHPPGITLADYLSPTSEWQSMYYQTYIQTTRQQKIRDQILECTPSTFCITIYDYPGSYVPSEYDSLYISFDRPNEDCNGIFTISRVENNKFYINVRQDQMPNFLSKVNNGSILLPYNGYVEIIPAHNSGNLINKNPNENNVFIKPVLNLFSNSAGDISSIVKKHTQYYDDITKRQLHCLSLNIPTKLNENGFNIISGSLPANNPCNIRMQMSDGSINNMIPNTTNILFNTQPIKIDNLSWKYGDSGDGWYHPNQNNYTGVINNAIILYNDINWKLQILTKPNHGNYTTGVIDYAPTVEIFGIKNYNISNINYVDISGCWKIEVDCSPITWSVDKDLIITIQDYTGKDSSILRIVSQPRLKVKDADTTVYCENNTSWSNLLNIYGVPPTQGPPINKDYFDDVSIEINSSPASYDYRWENSIGCHSVLVSEASNVSDSIINPVYKIEYSGQTVYRTGNTIATGLSSIPFTFRTQAFDINPIVFEPTCNSYAIPVIIPNLNDKIDTNSMSMTVNGGDLLVNNTEIEYDAVFKRFLAKIYLNSNNDYGLYKNVNFTFIYQTASNNVSSSITKNIIFAEPLSLDKQLLEEPVDLFIENPAILYFRVRGGDGTRNSEYSSSINICNKSILGFYNLNNVTQQYELIKNQITDVYDTGILAHNIRLETVKNKFDTVYFRDSGLLPISIYLEDSKQSTSGTILLNINKQPKIFNLESEKYVYFNKPIELSFDTDRIIPPVIKLPGSEISADPEKIYKYNPKLNIYAHNWTLPGITNIWDSRVALNDFFGAEDSTYSSTSFEPQCKGILDDNVYISAKLETLEVNNFSVSAPLEIRNLKTIEEVDIGDAWKLEFNVCYGIADAQYPPRIVLSGTPTECTGCAPVAFENPPFCLNARSFDANSKCWLFKFSGLPVCSPNQQEYPITITAIDTIGQATYDVDTANTLISYREPSPHPAPKISFTASDGQIYPECSTTTIRWGANVEMRSFCPAFTGIEYITLSGRIPKNLTPEITHIILADPSTGEKTVLRSDFNQIQFGTHYSGITGSNYITYSFPLTTVSGVSGALIGNVIEYGLNTIITGEVIDYGRPFKLRNSEPITIEDQSSTMKHRVQHGNVYFADDNYIKTKIQLSDKIKTLVYPPTQDSLNYNYSSYFFTGIDAMNPSAPYSGVFFKDSIENKIIVSGLSRPLPSPQQQGLSAIYIKFDNEPSYMNGIYTLNDVVYTPPQILKFSGPNINRNIANRTGCMFIFSYFGDGMDTAFGYTAQPPLVLDSNTNTGLLGCGIFVNGDIDNLTGILRPSFTGSPLLTEYEGNFVEYYPQITVNDFDKINIGLAISPLDGICCDHESTVLFKNCYETGLIRLSGIIVPKPILEITDIADFNLISKDQNISFAVRLAYGSTPQARSLLANQRLANIYGSTIDYYDIVESGLTLHGSQSIYGSTAPFATKTNTSGGLIFAHMQRESDKFPSHDQYAIPYVENKYYGIYQGVGGYNLNTNITTRDTFAPYGSINFDSFYFKDGDDMVYNGYIIGGFKPNNQYNFTNDPSKNNFVRNWQYSGYPPIYTGLLNEPQFDKHVAQYTKVGHGAELAKSYTPILIKLSGCDIINNVYSTGDLIYINQLSTGVLINGTGTYDIYGVNLSGNLDGIAQEYSDTLGFSEISKCVIYKQENNQLKIFPRASYTGTLAINDKINLISINPQLWYSQSYLSATGLLQIIGNSNNDFIADALPWNKLSGNIPVSGYGLLYKIIDDHNITTKLSYNSTYLEGSWDLQLSGTPPIGANKNYKYQILTIDNTSLPTINGLGWSTKQFSQTYDLYNVKPFKIYDVSTLDNSPYVELINEIVVNGSATNWYTSFYIENGLKPLQDNYPLITINDNKCGFIYTISYSSCYDMLRVDMAGTISMYGPVCLKISNQFYSKSLNMRT